MSRIMVSSLIVATALVGIICWEAQSAFQSGDNDTLRRPALSGQTASIPKQAPADPVEAWVTTSLERPLLRESRRPDRASGEAQRVGDDTPRLAGVVTGPFGNRAIFVMPGVVKPVTVKAGAQIGDLMVQSIEPGRVVVAAGGVSRTYKPLFAERNRKGCGGAKCL
jgi:hypothetical protein